MMIKLLTELLELPDSWVIFDAKDKNNEFWLYLKPNKLTLSHNIRSQILRHLDAFGKNTYIKLHFENDDDLKNLQFYTKIGFCEPFIKEIKHMARGGNDESICRLYNITKEDLDQIKLA